MEKTITKETSKEKNERIYKEILDGNFDNVSQLTELTDVKVAEALAEYENDLYFDNLKNITAEAAKALGQHEGLIYLKGLEEIEKNKKEDLEKFSTVCFSKKIKITDKEQKPEDDKIVKEEIVEENEKKFKVITFADGRQKTYIKSNGNETLYSVFTPDTKKEFYSENGTLEHVVFSYKKETYQKNGELDIILFKDKATHRRTRKEHYKKDGTLDWIEFYNGKKLNSICFYEDVGTVRSKHFIDGKTEWYKKDGKTLTDENEIICDKILNGNLHDSNRLTKLTNTSVAEALVKRVSPFGDKFYLNSLQQITKKVADILKRNQNIYFENAKIVEDDEPEGAINSTQEDDETDIKAETNKTQKSEDQTPVEETIQPEIKQEDQHLHKETLENRTILYKNEKGEVRFRLDINGNLFEIVNGEEIDLKNEVGDITNAKISDRFLNEEDITSFELKYIDISEDGEGTELYDENTGRLLYVQLPNRTKKYYDKETGRLTEVHYSWASKYYDKNTGKLASVTFNHLPNDGTEWQWHNPTITNERTETEIKETQTVVNSTPVEETEQEKTVEQKRSNTEKQKYILDQINETNVKLIFNKEKKDLTEEEIDNFLGNGDSVYFTEIKETDVESIRKHGVVYYSSNGFILLIDNQGKLDSPTGDSVDFSDEKAKFTLIGPDYKNLTDGLTYEQGKKLLEEYAKQYQEVLNSDFEEILKKTEEGQNFGNVTEDPNSRLSNTDETQTSKDQTLVEETLEDGTILYKNKQEEVLFKLDKDDNLFEIVDGKEVDLREEVNNEVIDEEAKKTAETNGMTYLVELPDRTKKYYISETGGLYCLKLPNGIVKNYYTQNGSLDSVILPDGIVWKNQTITNERTEKEILQEELQELQEEERLLLLEKQAHKPATEQENNLTQEENKIVQTEYHENGQISCQTFSDGKIKIYRIDGTLERVIFPEGDETKKIGYYKNGKIMYHVFSDRKEWYKENGELTTSLEEINKIICDNILNYDFSDISNLTELTDVRVAEFLSNCGDSVPPFNGLKKITKEVYEILKRNPNIYFENPEIIDEKKEIQQTDQPSTTPEEINDNVLEQLIQQRDALTKSIEKKRALMELLKKQIEELPDEFSASFVEEKVNNLLKSSEYIKEVKEKLKVEIINNEIKLITKVSAEKFGIEIEEIYIEAKLTNKSSKNNRIIGVESYKIKASAWQSKVEKRITSMIEKVPELLKSYLEKETGKKVKEFWVEDNEIKVTYII